MKKHSMFQSTALFIVRIIVLASIPFLFYYCMSKGFIAITSTAPNLSDVIISISTSALAALITIYTFRKTIKSTYDIFNKQKQTDQEARIVVWKREQHMTTIECLQRISLLLGPSTFKNLDIFPPYDEKMTTSHYDEYEYRCTLVLQNFMEIKTMLQVLSLNQTNYPDEMNTIFEQYISIVSRMLIEYEKRIWIILSSLAHCRYVELSETKKKSDAAKDKFYQALTKCVEIKKHEYLENIEKSSQTILEQGNKYIQSITTK